MYGLLKDEWPWNPDYVMTWFIKAVTSPRRPQGCQRGQVGPSKSQWWSRPWYLGLIYTRLKAHRQLDVQAKAHLYHIRAAVEVVRCMAKTIKIPYRSRPESGQGYIKRKRSLMCNLLRPTCMESCSQSDEQLMVPKCIPQGRGWLPDASFFSHSTHSVWCHCSQAGRSWEPGTDW